MYPPPLCFHNRWGTSSLFPRGPFSPWLFIQCRPQRSLLILHHLLHHFAVSYDTSRFSENCCILHKIKVFRHYEALLFLHHLKDIELQVLFEQMLDFTGFSGTWFLNLPLAYHSFFCYIKFAIRSISSVSVLSRTWQYRSIVICKELWPNIFCNVLGSIPFSIQFVAKVWRNPWGVRCSKNWSGFSLLIRATI